MTDRHFTLIVDGLDLDDQSQRDALYEAGCDDAVLSVIAGQGQATFDREAPSLAEAIVSAVRDIERVAGLAVTSIETDEMVHAADIATRAGRTRQSISQLMDGVRGPGGFPAPAAKAGTRSPLWRWSDVARWLNAYDPAVRADDDLDVLVAADAVLTWRRVAHHLPEADTSRLVDLAAH